MVVPAKRMAGPVLVLVCVCRLYAETDECLDKFPHLVESDTSNGEKML